MKTNLINWLIKLLQPKYTKEQIKRINSIKARFQIFFDGIYDEVPAQVSITTWQLGITNFDFEFKGNLLIMTITLLRPGLLIGKGGTTIDLVSAFLSTNEHSVEIKIKESKLWNRLK